MKKVLSIILCLCIVLSVVAVVPFGTSAAESEIAETGESGTTGDCTWTLVGTKLTISGNGAMADYYWGGAPWGTSIAEVIIADGVTKIGNYAFSYCYGLTSVTIPDSVTSIGEGAFSHCCDLTSITIPDSVTSIGNSAFPGCSSLNSVTILGSVTSIGEFAFYGCSSLTSVTIPDSVTSIGYYAFCRCSNLTSIDIPDSVTSIDNSAFNGCKSLSSVTIPDSVTSIKYSAFAYCSGLSSISVSYKNTVYDSRNNCNAIIKTDTNTLISGCMSTIIPDSVTSIGDMAFSGCTGLTSITIPDSVTSIGNSAFDGCFGLTSVTIPDSVTSIGYYAFDGCTALTDVYYSGSEAEWTLIDIGYGNDYLTNATIHYNSYGSNSTIDYQSYYGFNQTTYMVDQWVDTSKHFNACINNMINMEDPAQSIVNQLKSSKSFILSVAGWETAKFLNNPVKILDREISQKEFYEAILLSLINEQLDNKSVMNYITSSSVTSSVNLSKSFADFVKKNSSAGMDYNYLLTTKPLTNDERDAIKEIMKGWNVSKISDDLSFIGKVLSYSKDIYEFETTYCKYLALSEVEDSIVLMLDEMYKNSDPANLALRGAIAEVRAACNSQWGIFKAQIANGTILISSWTADAICGHLWNKVCSTNVYTICLRAGLVVGTALSNFAFSTDSTIGKYYTLKCLCDVRKVIKISTTSLGNAYRNNRTEENAKAYIGAVDFLYGSYNLSCDYSVDYCSTGYNSIAGKILWKNDNSLDLLKQSAANCKQVVSNEHKRTLLKDWCYCLQDDYPELFDEVAEKIGLYVYADLKDANIRVSVLTTEYDGTELTPPVSVYLNGIELEENRDFTLTYSNNVNPGLAKVTVKGINHYEGEKTVTFVIKENPFNSQIDIVKLRRGNIRNNINTRQTSLAPVGYQAGDTLTDFTDVNILISKNGVTYLDIENGIIKNGGLQIVDSENELSILLIDDSYDISITSSYNNCINYSYTTYDEEYNERTSRNYNELSINNSLTLTSHIANEQLDVYLNELLLFPDYDSTNTENNCYSITVNGGISSLFEASFNQWINIEAIPEYGYRFVKWEVVNGAIEILNETSQACHFVMPDSDVELRAVYKKIILGDVDGDDDVSIIDATFIQRYLASIPISFEWNELLADTDEDGEVSIIDATYIQRWLVGIPCNDNIGLPIE